MANVPFDRRPVDDPAELGIDATALDELFARAQKDIDGQRIPSCQIALARDGRVAVSRTLGAAQPESRYVIFSATKPVVAGGIWILMGEGLLDVSRRVAEFIPEFGTNGKDVITVEQVLLHTSGFPAAPFVPVEWDDRERRLERFAQWRCNWEPGTRFEYHPTSAHWVLAELIERVSGQDFRVFLRERVLDPLGLTGLQVGVPRDQQGDINDLVRTGEPMTREELQATLGIDKLPVTEVTPEALVSFNRPEVRAVGSPGGGGVSSAIDLALYYQGLLHNPAGTWKPDVLADVTGTVRNTFTDWMGTPANRTRGLVIAGDDGKSNARGMGRTVSAQTFGHNGAGGQIAWADPATGLSFCYLTNGLDQHQLTEWRRTTAIASRGGRDRALTALFGLAVAFVVVAPLTRRGWLLLLDWVPGPRQIGATGGAALPTGPVFWWPVSAAHSLFGAAVGWLPLALALALAAAGAAQLVGGPWAARVAAGVAYAWNPFVYDRIAVGQMSVLAGYALLPWLLRSALRAKSWRGALIVGMWWAAVALCTLHFAWIGGLLVVCVAIVRARELGAVRALAGFAITVALAAAVIGLGVLGSHPSISPRGSVAVLTSFGTRSDPSLGRSLGILAQQGFWRSVVARPRDDLDAFFPVIAGASIAVAVFGLVLARGTARARLAASVAIAGVAGWLLAHGNAGPFGSVYRAMFEHVPGFGVMREAQKWVALVSLAIAVGTGCLAAAIARTRASLAAWAVVLVPIALAPTLAWGLSDRIEPARYPSSWAAVRSAVDRVPGDIVALPWEQYPMSVITGDRTIANPAPAYFGSRIITSRNPGVDGLPGDTGRRADIAAAVDAARADAAAGRPVRLGAALAALGYRGVLEIGSPDVPLERDTTLTRQAGADGVVLWVVNPQH